MLLELCLVMFLGPPSSHIGVGVTQLAVELTNIWWRRLFEHHVTLLWEQLIIFPCDGGHSHNKGIELMHE